MMPVATVDPFRLHVFGVPAWRAPAVVKRGSRAYPLDLVWVPLVSSFLMPACPSCGSRATLVAGKSRLGCRNCTQPEATPEPVVSAVGPVEVTASPPPASSATPRPSEAQQGRPSRLLRQLRPHGRRQKRRLFAAGPPSDLQVASLRRAPPAVSPRKAVRLRVPTRWATAWFASSGNRCSTTRR